MCSDVGMRSIAFLLLAASAQGAQPVTIPAAGLKQPAEILIDKWGVPHIYAGSVDDAFFAQGFNAARDRLFQIDLWRRRGLGLLAEVLGPFLRRTGPRSAVVPLSRRYAEGVGGLRRGCKTDRNILCCGR